MRIKYTTPHGSTVDIAGETQDELRDALEVVREMLAVDAGDEAEFEMTDDALKNASAGLLVGDSFVDLGVALSSHGIVAEAMVRAKNGRAIAVLHVEDFIAANAKIENDDFEFVII